jgi:hypothetical protein
MNRGIACRRRPKPNFSNTRRSLCATLDSATARRAVERARIGLLCYLMSAAENAAEALSRLMHHCRIVNESCA